MGYIAVLVAALILVPLFFLLAGRRPAGNRGDGSSDHGVTPSEPSSDQPTPRANAVNQLAPEAEKQLPPG
jgi:hypothetical protein